MQYYPKHTKSLITQLHADLPNIITTLQMMEARLVAQSAIMEQQKEKLRVAAIADELIAKVIEETPDYEIQIVPKPTTTE